MAIISMIIEDVRHEMKVAREEEAEAQRAYEESMDSCREVLESQIATKTA
eukprot:CAMPEP_0172714536 /NCGR_PEP_ID=MMETSP1074-20121228/66097_1 /TAXON_ID=2916 /ORGANISM="Ceratium fusus, Strain PA161109" /LENGTH=49 /DNA_ID= /DNA_START= /DNA_END= /DNA_ORIENTATION=